MFNKRNCLTALVVMTLLAGCASGTKRDTGSSSTVVAQKVVVSPASQLTSVSLTTSDEVNQKRAELVERGFSIDTLMERLKKQLNSKNLVASSTTKPNLSLEVNLDGVRFRTTAGAIWAGFMAGADYIKATVVVKDAKGAIVDKFQVETTYAFGGLAGGPAGVRTDWLYENFGNEVVKELTGAGGDAAAK